MILSSHSGVVAAFTFHVDRCHCFVRIIAVPDIVNPNVIQVGSGRTNNNGTPGHYVVIFTDHSGNSVTNCIERLIDDLDFKSIWSDDFDWEKCKVHYVEHYVGSENSPRSHPDGDYKLVDYRRHGLVSPGWIPISRGDLDALTAGYHRPECVENTNTKYYTTEMSTISMPHSVPDSLRDVVVDVTDRFLRVAVTASGMTSKKYLVVADKNDINESPLGFPVIMINRREPKNINRYTHFPWHDVEKITHGKEVLWSSP